MREAHAVILRDVTKRYSGHTAVAGLSLSIPRGSLYGLLGPNGAGKTTTIRMVLNILLPDEGTIEVLGRPAWDRTLASRIGYLPEERGLYRKMKVLDLLVFLAETRGVGRKEARGKAGEWLERLGLSEWSGRKVEQLSKGMQQKVQFISTVLHDPELLILDEPFAGLDPVNSQVLKDTVVELARGGTTVLFSTHIMEHAEKLCDSVCIIARGRKVVDGPLSEVKRAHGGKHVVLALEEWRDGLIDEALQDRSLVTRVDRYGQYAELELADGAAPQEVLERVLRAGAKVTRFEVSEPSLHKIFIDKVGEVAQ
ncbi:MAG: putative ABC transporter ATP-binding protein YhaQ [Gemmatimonadales bacterium]|nr:putative ABC transporter ATP-binding protein YxlF [bacterium HR33]GIW52904.1 MAG: putative ABC transporter ATP-binding protein YhaQ [Gemmatimonadales bacterium]